MEKKVAIELTLADWQKVFTLLEHVDEHMASGSPINPVITSHPDYRNAFHTIRKACGYATLDAVRAEYYRQKDLGIEKPSFKESDLVDK